MQGTGLVLLLTLKISQMKSLIQPQSASVIPRDLDSFHRGCGKLLKYVEKYSLVAV